MYGPLAKAKFISYFWGISHTVLYNFLICSGIFEISKIEPLCATSQFLISDVHKFNLIKSLTRCLLTHTNSPARTLLVKTFEVTGSKLSLFPNTYEVDAVGIGASNKEFLAPNCITSLLSFSQSYRFEAGLTSQRSNQNFP